jgi:tetratricopeptide (TPR) repeat protein
VDVRDDTYNHEHVRFCVDGLSRKLAHDATAHTRTAAEEVIAAKGNCIDCHMPKRRTDDAVHVVMTDHFIQRTAGKNLTAPLKESESRAFDTHRGQVVSYYPVNHVLQLYLDIAQVQDDSNTDAGILKLQHDLKQSKPADPQMSLELAEAYFREQRLTQAIHWYEAALRIRPDFAPAAAGLGLARLNSGNLSAVESLQKAASVPHPDPIALTNLGVVLLKQVCGISLVSA